MQLPKSLTSITPFSRILAMLLFVTFPIVGFFAGMEYQKSLNPQAQNATPKSTISNFDDCVTAGNPVMESYPRQCVTEDGLHFVEEIKSQPTSSVSPTKNPSSEPNPDNQVVCTQDVKLCPDGSYVGRSGPNCEFAACPATP